MAAHFTLLLSCEDSSSPHMPALCLYVHRAFGASRLRIDCRRGSKQRHARLTPQSHGTGQSSEARRHPAVQHVPANDRRCRSALLV